MVFSEKLVSKVKTNKMRWCREEIDDFRVSTVILLGGPKSGQTFHIMPWSRLWCLSPPSSESCKGYTMKFEVKYIFLSPSSVANFCIYQLPERLGMRKSIAPGIRMQKNPQTMATIFWIFLDFHRVMQI